MRSAPRHASATITAALLALAGCAANPAATPAPTPAPPTSASPSVTPTPTPSPTATSAGLRVGDKAALADGALSVEVVKLQRGEIPTRPRPTYVALIRMCNVSLADPIGPGWEPWSLVTADGEQYPSSSETYSEDPLPAYPFFAGDRQLSEGDCARGWVVFETAKGAKAATVEYDNEAGDHLEWAA